MTEGGRPKTDPSLKKAREKAKMQRYRKRQADLYTQLNVEAFHLESQVMHHTNAVAQRRVLRPSAVSSLLPWKEVLAAIRDDMDELTTANDALRARSQAVDRLAKAMQRWVHNAQYFPSPSSLSSSLHASGTLCRTPWRHVTLDAAPATRTLGFDWITKNLCHNHELVFQQCHFPPITSPDRVADFGVDTTDGMERLQYIWRIQDDVAVPLSTVRDAFARPHFLSQVLGKHLTNTSSISPHISAAMQADEHLLSDFGGHACYFHSQWGATSWVHFLTREFHLSDDRCLFVAQCVHEDPLMPASPHSRHRMIWYE
ncbi:hypothetical protein DYB30_012166 [Aphanomyces astaci]|uniref:Uncharacterized protein n=1 Tax=Aphanomyces astaci TaxID=112090 RepID=A0A397E4E8_APHAT|nr:hypothetical protein DYB30_012166 [Aphanomyces astaci]